MFKNILFIILLTASVCFAEKVNLEADRITSIDNNTVFAEGNVLITYKNIIMVADNVTYYKDQNLTEAEGNVVFQDDQNYLTAEYLKINLTTKKGSIKNGKGFYAPHTYFSAESIEKTGENNFVLSNANITSCNQEKPDWHFHSRIARIDYGEYFKSKHTTFNIADIPVLYTPYFVWPIKKKRESGFLVPEIGFKTDAGLFITPKYFSNLGVNKDITAGINYFTMKGPMLNTEFRYAKSSRESVYLYGEFIDDQNSKSNKNNRYRIVNKSNLFILENLELKFNTDYVSDFKYKEDFDDFAPKNDIIELNSDENYSVNEIRLNYRLKYSDISLRYLDNMHYYINSTGYTKNHIIRKPNLIFEKYGLNFYGIKFDYFADYNKVLYTNYSYNIFGSESGKSTGYDRYFVKLKIYKPYNLKIATLTPYYIQSTTYWNNFENLSISDNRDFESEFLNIDYSKDNIKRYIYTYGAKLYFNEIYKDYSSFRHSIFNSFEYKFTPYLYQSKLPNFIDNDIIDEENYYSYTMTNFIKNKNWNLKIEISEKYNIVKEEERFEPLLLTSLFNYRDIADIVFETNYNFYTDKSTYLKNSYNINFKNLGIHTEYIFDNTITDYNTTFKYGLSYNAENFEVDLYQKFASYEKSVKFTGLKKQELSVKWLYKSDCWNAGLLLKENYYDIVEKNSINKGTARTVYLLVEFKGLGKTERKILETK
ncbi:MAG: OstA family protein [Deferribacteraceae bacterium]|nr:OstA family protein [Deferribacteraceae bacterium]